MKRNLMNQFFMMLSMALVLTFASSCGGDEADDEMMEPTADYNYMSLKLNGTDFNGLTNASFGFFNTESTMVITSTDNVKFLWLQGDHEDFQVNIRLHENMWMEGTYPLIEGTSLDADNAKLTYLTSGDNGDFDYEVEGSVSITEFDLENKILKGTFSFSSPDNTATGTLDYPLDAAEFQ